MYVICANRTLRALKQIIEQHEDKTSLSPPVYLRLFFMTIQVELINRQVSSSSSHSKKYPHRSEEQLVFLTDKTTTTSFAEELDSLLDDCTHCRGRNADDEHDENVEHEGEDLISDAFLVPDQTQPEPKPFPNIELYSQVHGQEDVHHYMHIREMTPLQEKLNALTVLPSPMYCLYFIVSGEWINIQNDYVDLNMSFIDEYDFKSESCWDSWLFPDLRAMPPLPVILAALGVILHFPFSFIYHWKYAIELPPGFPRIGHWSRRLDHCFIHVISACFSLCSSGSWIYFCLCVLFNSNCAILHFKKKISPRRNQIRLAVALTLGAVPFLIRGEIHIFTQILSLLMISGWLFITYPFGGWSHALFHIVVAFIPRIVIQSACELQSSQFYIEVATRCSTLFN